MRNLPIPLAGAALLTAALLLASCADAPVLRSRVDANIAAPTNSNDPVAAQCQQLRDQIRANQEQQREAVTLSTNPQIVAAAQAKADQHVDQLRDRMDELDCADQQLDTPKTAPPRITPLPPAPNAPNP
jgi:hypothetical protein